MKDWVQSGNDKASRERQDGEVVRSRWREGQIAMFNGRMATPAPGIDQVPVQFYGRIGRGRTTPTSLAFGPGKCSGVGLGSPLNMSDLA